LATPPSATCCTSLHKINSADNKILLPGLYEQHAFLQHFYYFSVYISRVSSAGTALPPAHNFLNLWTL